MGGKWENGPRKSAISGAARPFKLIPTLDRGSALGDSIGSRESLLVVAFPGRNYLMSVTMMWSNNNMYKQDICHTWRRARRRRWRWERESKLGPGRTPKEPQNRMLMIRYVRASHWQRVCACVCACVLNQTSRQKEATVRARVEGRLGRTQREKKG